MSGGSFDYSDYALESIAETMAEKLTHGGQEAGSTEVEYANPAKNLPRVAAWLPPILMELRTLVHEIDYHLADDSQIADEDAWLTAAQAKLAALVMDVAPPTRAARQQALEKTVEGLDTEFGPADPSLVEDLKRVFAAPFTVWTAEQAKERVPSLIEDGHLFLADVSRGGEDVKFSKGSKRTTRGINYGSVQWLENATKLLATAVTTIQTRQYIVGEATLDQARVVVADEGHPEDLRPLTVLMWNPAGHLNGALPVVTSRHSPDKIERIQARMLKYLNTLASQGPDLGVHLVLVGDVPDFVRAQSAS